MIKYTEIRWIGINRRSVTYLRTDGRLEKVIYDIHLGSTLKAGSMEPDRTTTIGDSEPVTTIRPKKEPKMLD